ncbi:hypothetical protein BCV69DRAFT_278948 [Microstroma glucosiphilum]|uniref:CoA-dependent acyltransferase n=1 Tax=Pseudomicrostroma glucosiphilum TaxID=1684307 RepID=A0A316U232_9BASI|nr:hypothetical protein BCV69DRAFT_278948 [Pseudomicrostroma glucosiphilum]PWN18541.1 hypothetical protein BCV69DRAFT_278948 [Pseudomicrostroma glucosiphilum]
MAAISQELSLPSEWRKDGDGSLSRRLKGFEVVINMIEFHQSGNCELIITGDLESSMTPDELEHSIYPAWVKTRQQHPMVGVRLPSDDLSNAVFAPFETALDAQEWCEQTIVIAKDDLTMREVADRCKATPLDRNTGRLPQIHLVSRPFSGTQGIVLHSSHVLSGHFVMTILEEIARQLVQDDCTGGVQGVFRKEVPEDLIERLPISAVYAYEQASHIPTPTQQDISSLAARQAQNAQVAMERVSVGPSVRDDWHGQNSRMQSYFKDFPQSTLASLKAAMRQDRVTMTAAYWACIILASLDFSTAEQLQKANGVECLFSTHTRRWFQSPNTAPITMGVIPSSFWLDKGELEGQAKDRKMLTRVAQRVMTAQEAAIESVHILKQIDTSTRALYETTTQNGTRPMPSPQPDISKPTLTSQGIIELPEWYGTDIASGEESNKSRWLRYTDYRYGGRHTDPSICFALLVFRGKLRVQALYDEKYFEKERAEAYISRTVELLTLWLSHEEVGTEQSDAVSGFVARTKL